MAFLKQPFPSFREKDACEAPKEEGSETSGQEICPTDALRISPGAGKEDKGDHGYWQWSLYLNKLLLYEALGKWQFGAFWFSLFSLQEQSEHRSVNYEGHWSRREMDEPTDIQKL